MIAERQEEEQKKMGHLTRIGAAKLLPLMLLPLTRARLRCQQLVLTTLQARMQMQVVMLAVETPHSWQYLPVHVMRHDLHPVQKVKYIIQLK